MVISFFKKNIMLSAFSILFGMTTDSFNLTLSTYFDFESVSFLVLIFL
jgi:hypothetical protein